MDGRTREILLMISNLVLHHLLDHLGKWVLIPIYTKRERGEVNRVGKRERERERGEE